MIVLDSSIAASWFLPDEKPAIDVLEVAKKEGACVSTLWHFEIANVLLVAERRKRLASGTSTECLEALALLRLEIDLRSHERAWTETWEISRRHGLTVHDASYLELALRRRLPLATRDRELAAAAKKNGIKILD